MRTWSRLKAHGALNLEEAVPVDITNVFEWQQADWDLDDPHKREQVFSFCHGMRPSFHSTWFEWRMNHINTKGARPAKIDGRAIWAVECPEVLPGWTMLVFERQDGDVILTHVFGIDLQETTGSSVAVSYPEDEDTNDPTFRLHEFVWTVGVTVILAQNLMHCKNVVVEREAVPPKLAKNFARKNNGTRPTSFRKVKIEPMKTVFKNCGGVQAVGVEKAMHIVRGNFADYTEERPLFGKVVGRFFRAQHVRGNPDLGVKTPEYAVVRPKSSEA